MAESKITPELKKTIPWRLVATFLLFSIMIILMGIYYYKSQRNKMFVEQEKTLSAIAILKIDQIEQWRKERLGDAKVIIENEPLIDQINLFFRNKNESVIKRKLEKWMKSEYKYSDYSSVLLVDTSLKVRLSVLPYDTVAGDAIHEQLKNVISKNIIIMTDLHRSTSVNYVHLDLIIPLQKPEKEEKKPFGLLILRIDPTKILFPLIQSWPTSSKSSETLLLRREKDSILYLNELRHQKNTALNLRLPLSNKSLLGSIAVAGYEGVFEGVDYRNIPVVGYLKHIPGLQWYMVAKVDKNEIQAPLKNQFYIAALGIILLILINASVFGFWIWDQRLKMYRLQLKDEIAIHESKEKLIESEELFRSLFENMLNGFAYCKMLYTDGHQLDFLYINVNAAFESLTGLKNVKGKKVSEVIPGIEEADPELLEAYNRVALTGNPEVFETYVESMKMWFFISVYSPQKEYFVTVFDIITKRKLAEEALRENEKRLREVQEMAHLGFWLWDIKSGNVEWSEEVFKIFCLDPETFTPKIDSIIELSPWPENNQRDKELLRRAIETHEPGTYEQKFLRPDKSIGYYYSTFRGNYDNNGDLISIVGTVLDITDRKLAEVALRESEDKFKYIFDHSLVAKSITLPSGEININKAFCEMLGYQAEELKKINWADISHPDDIELTNDSLNLILSGKKDSVRFIKRYIHKNGSIVWADLGTSLRRDNENNPQYFMTSVNDITERKAAEEALRESEERFSTSFRISPISFMIANMEDGRIIEVNDAFTTISGFTREEALASTTLDLKIWVNEHDRNHMIDSLRKGRSILHQETQLRSKEGKIALVLLSAQVIKLANRNCIISSIEDITKRKEAEDELRIQSEIMSHMAEAVYLVRMKDGIIVYTNSKFEELFGYGPGDMTGKHASIVNAPTEKSPEQTAIEIMSQLDKKGFWTGEVLNIKKDRTVFWSHANVAIFNHSKYGKVLVSVQEDITDRKNAEFQIKKLNEELEVRVIQRTELLEAANKELEAFSYSVSHDLRAPLRSVHSFTKILMEEYEDKLDAEGKRICGIISSSATQMGGLIDDLLNFSRIGRSSLNQGMIDMNSLSAMVFTDLSNEMEKSRTNLKIGKLHRVYGDQSLIKQVWNNLISNALKYSSKEITPEISIGSSKEGEMITYFIKDNGVGFDMQYVHKLFGVFQRLHSEAEFEGNGVGLAIVQRVIVKHGGKVWAEGDIGKGATFYFALPVQDINKKTHDTRHTTHG